MRDQGVRFAPIYGRQAFKVDGKFKFWGGLTLEAVGGGPGLVDRLDGAPSRRGIEIRLRGPGASRCIAGDDGVTGVVVRHGGQHARRSAPTRSCWPRGGFQANAEWRTRYLGPGWDLAKVRGTRFNTGDGIADGARHRRAARRATGRAATPWPGSATPRTSATWPWATASRSTATRSAIMVNADGERFVDEGADFRNYTYAKYGRRILEQPRPVRLADLRRQGRATCCATSTASGRSPRSPPTP